MGGEDARPTPMAVLGYSLFLPKGIHGGDKLFEVVRDKRQVTVHREEIKYPPKIVMDNTRDGSSWKYRVDYGNYFTEEEVMNTDKKLFRISEKESYFTQQAQIWSLEAAFRALEHAGITLEQVQGTKTGIFVGGFSSQPVLRTAPDETSIRGTLMSSIADKVAFYLGTHGPSMTCETACSTSLVALSQAVAYMRKGDCDMALVIGCSVRPYADYLVQMQALGVMSPRGLSNPFDENADGMGRAEAYGCMIIKRMDLAEMHQNRILATLVNACASHAGAEDDVIEGSGRVYEAPCAPGINKLIRMCYEQAKVPMEHIRYIEAHGTGTPVGDRIELDGISMALRDHHHAVYNPLRVASVKGNLGHAEIAAGMIGLVKAMEMIRHRIFLPSGGLTKPRQDFDWAANAMLPMVDEEPFPENGEPVYIGVNAFGLGGAYGHAILTEYKKPAQKALGLQPVPPLSPPGPLAVGDEDEAYHVLPISAASEAHLKLYETVIADFLQARSSSSSLEGGKVGEHEQEREAGSTDSPPSRALRSLDPTLSASAVSALSPSSSSADPTICPAQLLRDVAGTMWCNRSRMRYRRTYVANSVADLVEQLKNEDKKSMVSVIDPAVSKKEAANGVALVFTGQGAQWLGCGERLVTRFPVYRRAVEAVDAIFTKVTGWSLRARAATLTKEELMQTQFAQPITFMVQVGITELLKSFRLRATVVIGHSAGEVAAAYASGKLTLEQAVKLVYHRSQLQQRLAGSGRMMVVGMSASEAAAFLESAGSTNVHVACVNSAQSVVLAGRESDLQVLDALLPGSTRRTWVLGNIAFHCPLVEPILQDMHKRLSPFLPADHKKKSTASGTTSAAAAATTSTTDGGSSDDKRGEELQPAGLDGMQVLAKINEAASASRQADAEEEESDVAFISTVTGAVYDGPLSPDYWVQNVREPVYFQAAVEALVHLPGRPRYIIEVGPHKTLLGPLLQTAQAAGGDTGAFVAALPTLKRNEPDDAMFMAMLGKLFEAGMYTLSLDKWYRRDEAYELLRNLPGHPMIRTPLVKVDDICLKVEEEKPRGFSCGPTAGQYVGPDKMATVIEVSDQNMPKMLEHVMGGTPLLPGAFFVVAAIEALGGVPCTMTDVATINTCKIPQDLDSRVVLRTTLEKEDTRGGDAFRFTTLTTPKDEESATVNCTGRVFRDEAIAEALRAKMEEEEEDEKKRREEARKRETAQQLEEDDESEDTPRPLHVDRYAMGRYCLQARLDLHDIGKEGIKELIAKHPVVVAKDNKEVYQIINVPGIREWGPTFALAQSAHTTPDRMSLLTRMSSNCMGEYYTPQLIDCVFHLGILCPLTEPYFFFFNGGFDKAHFVRVPGPGDLYVNIVFKRYLALGRVKRFGDIHVYDAEGRLIMRVEGLKLVLGSDQGSIRLAEMHWQPYASTASAEELESAVKSILERKGPPPHCHDAMAEVVCSVGLSKAARTVDEAPIGTGVHVRVLLDCNADDSPLLCQALLVALADHERLSAADMVVELYTVLRKSSLLEAVNLKVPSRAASWLRFRRAVLPLAMQQLGDMAFDVIITSQLQRDDMPAIVQGTGAQEVVWSLLNVRQSTTEAEEEKDETQNGAVEEGGTTAAGTSAVAEGASSGAENGGRTSEIDGAVTDAGDTVKVREEAAPEPAVTGAAAAAPASVVAEEGSWQEEKERAATFPERKQEEEAAVMATPVVLSLSSGLRGLCFHENEEVFAVGGDDGTLFVGRAPVPPVIRHKMPIPSKQAVTEEEKSEGKPEEDPEDTQGDEDATAQLSRDEDGEEAPRREVLVVSDSLELAEEMKTQLMSSAVDEVRVLLCGEGSSLPLLDEAREVEEGVSEKAVVKAWMDALREQVGPLACREIVFLAGMTDESPLSATGYYRLLRLAKAVSKLQTPPLKEEASGVDGAMAAAEQEEQATHEEQAKSKKEEKEEPDLPGMEGSEEWVGPKVMWVVTKGCFGDEVVIGQASLYAAARNLELDVDDLRVRYADLAGPKCLPQLASLVLSQPRERYFRVSGDQQVLVQRFHVHEAGKTLNTCTVSADDPTMAYSVCLPYEEEYPTPGQVTVEMRAWPVPPPADDEVTVRVHSSGLNFRDALMAMSLMPVESFENSYYGKILGMEASGMVVSVGKNVPGLKPGQRVLISDSNSFCSLMNSRQTHVHALSEESSYYDGAACQVAYSTAHRGLVDMARVKKGETVLVHAAAGGVGMAAVSICKAYGAEVYATASAGKRDVVAKLGVDPSRIFDSRSESWFEDLMRATNGQGVDIVFNSLAGKHQQLGMEALRSNGRFCEIGKIDVYRNASIGLMAMARNCSFIMVDMDEWAKTSFAACVAQLQTGLRLVADKTCEPLPITAYPMSEAREAMDLMKTGKHTGKVLLTNYEDPGSMARPRSVQARLDYTKCCYDAEGVYLVTGGGGGFGSSIVRHAASLGARHFVVTLTRDAESRVASLFGDLLETGDVEIHAVTANLSRKEDVARVVDFCRSLDKPLRAIIHCAGRSLDVTLHQIKRGDLEDLAGPKNMAAWWLHEMTLDIPTIKDFAVVSSASADLAARGLLVYGPTNAMLNSFVRYRQAMGLPACALNMATLCDVGIVADQPAVRQIQIAAGLEMLPSARACRDLAEVIISKKQLLELQLNQPIWTAVAHTFLHNVTTTVTLGAREQGERRLAPEEAVDFILQTVRDITKSDDVMPGDALASVSIDSLSLMDLTSRVKKATGVELQVGKLKATNSIADVAEMVAQQMRAADGGVMDSVVNAAANAAAESTQTLEMATELVKHETEKEERRARRRAQAALQPTCSVFEADEQTSAMAGMTQEHRVDRCFPATGVVPKFWRGRANKKEGRRSGGAADKKCSGLSEEEEGSGEMTPLKARQWFKIYYPNKEAQCRLLAIPYCGRSCQNFGMWVLPGVEIVATQIPGKEGREDEAKPMNLVEWAEKIAQAVVFAGLLDDGMPLSHSGHSSGSVLALETCRALQKYYKYSVQHLFVCSLQAPHLMSDFPWLARKLFLALGFNKPGFQMLTWMAGGLPRPFFLDRRRQMFIDGTWKQMGMVKKYSETHALPIPANDVLNCPITVMFGDHDILSNAKFGKMWWRNWDAYSHEKVRTLSFEGHHFFLEQPKLIPLVLQAIRDTIMSAGEKTKPAPESQQPQ